MKKSFENINGVNVCHRTKKDFFDFETLYIDARSKENRVLSVEEIRQLPKVSVNSSHYKEWCIREKSINRFLDYLGTKKSNLKILDIGCGNGFFTNLMSHFSQNIVGVDVNLTELQQAVKAFPNSPITWYYIDILNEQLPLKDFDIITFCASFQYFNNPEEIIKVCQSLLNHAGEIHIIDSPFYSLETKTKAQSNSENYYRSLGVAEMTKHYHHHTLEVLKSYSIEFKYKPNVILRRLFKDSPFPWIKIG